MAKITPIDIIKGISGKFGGGNSKEYFATNKTSYNIYFAKRVNEFQGPATVKQQEVCARFKSKQKAVADWLRANRPANGRPCNRGLQRSALPEKPLQIFEHQSGYLQIPERRGLAGGASQQYLHQQRRSPRACSLAAWQ